MIGSAHAPISLIAQNEVQAEHEPAFLKVGRFRFGVEFIDSVRLILASNSKDRFCRQSSSLSPPTYQTERNRASTFLFSRNQEEIMQHTLRTKLAKAVSVLALGCALACATAPKASADPNLNFTFTNQTKKTIDNVFLVPSSKKDVDDKTVAEGQVLNEGQTIKHGEAIDIEFAPKTKAHFWDMYVSFTDGKESVWLHLDLSTITEITISYRNGAPHASTKVAE